MAATASSSFNRVDLDAMIANMKEIGAPEGFDLTKEPEVQTDKERVKLAACRECQRPLVVTTFFAPAKAICRVCKGEGEGTVATVGQPVPGQTDPAKAVNLADCLINPTFAYAVCPFDAEHEVELKMITHSPHYGPRKLLKYDNRGVPIYHQEMGETVTHQCKECRVVITYSTQHQNHYRRQNEVRTRDGIDRSPLEMVLGVHEEQEPEFSEEK